VKLKYKIYKTSEIEINATGHKFDIPGRMLPVGTPLFAVYDKKGKGIYPKFGKGEREESCKRWVKENCWLPGDKPYPKKLLERLAELEPRKQLENLTVILNNRVYEGNRHDDYSLVFQEEQNYFQFDYYQSEWGSLCLGKWMRQSLQVDAKNYLCKRVYPRERTVRIREFKFDKD